MTTVLATIITYNPEIERLLENINSIYKQVDTVLIVDNNSDNISRIEETIDIYKNVEIKKNEINIGIAGALKVAMNYASKNSYDWVLSLDQDSVCLENLISIYEPYLTDSTIGALTCQFRDRNLDNLLDFDSNTSTTVVSECITSGMLMRMAAYRLLDGYRNELFIDWVDFDICYQLKESGFKILRINKLGLVQEVGDGKTIKFLGRRYHIFNHNEMRNFYMARNAIIVTRRYFGNRRLLKQVLKQILRIYLLRYESKRAGKMKARINGIYTGFKYNLK